MNKNTLQVSDELPKDWTITTLGEVLPIFYGKSLTESKRDGQGKYPVYGSSGKVGQHSQALTRKAALLIGRKGSVGAVYYSPEPCWPIDTTYFAEEREDIDLRFFEYLLKGLNLRALDKSTAVPGLSRDDYNAVQVAVAPIQDQKLIVAEIEKQFSRLDEAVANLKRVKANLRRYKAAVLKAAIEGKLTEAWRRKHPVLESAGKYLNRILDEKKKKWQKENPDKKYRDTAPLNVSSTASLPEGWAWTTIDQFVFSAADCPHSTPKYVDHGVVCARTSDFKPGYLDLSKASYVTEDSYNQRVSRLIPMAGDVLYSREGGILGIACMVPEKTRLCLGQRMMLLRTESRDSSKYLTHVLNSPFILNKVRALTGGSASPHLNVGEIRNFVLPMPPLAERTVILQEIDRRFSGAEISENAVDIELIRAERLRQSILYAAFTGKLEIQYYG